MNIKVLGPGCAKCNKTERMIKEVIAETGIDAEVEKVTDMLKISEYGVIATPGVVVNGDVKCAGRVPKEKEIRSWFSE